MSLQFRVLIESRINVSSFRDFSDIPYIDDPPPSLSPRRSTPPPNYETAVALPALTEEQREVALSTLSLQKIT